MNRRLYYSAALLAMFLVGLSIGYLLAPRRHVIEATGLTVDQIYELQNKLP